MTVDEKKQQVNEDLESVLEMFEDIYKEVGYKKQIPSIELKYSSRLSITLGYYQYKTFKPSITLSEYILKFDYDDVFGILMHEVAHFFCHVLYGPKCGHGIKFKKMCKLLGGSMNSLHAKGQFSNCLMNPEISKNCKNNQVKYIYECKCGACKLHYKKKMSKTSRMYQYSKCKYCGQLVKDFKVVTL